MAWNILDSMGSVTEDYGIDIDFNKFNRFLYNFMTIYTMYIIWLVLPIMLHNGYFLN